MFQVAFVDLDDTLFSSLHKHDGESGLEPAALLRDGRVISHTSSRQRALVHWLSASDRVIPVTARTPDAFARVLLGFNGHAVLSHGATILGPDGTQDEDWRARVDHLLPGQLEALVALREQLETTYGGDGGLRVRLVGEPDRPAYLIVKNPQGDPEPVLRASRECVMPWIKAHPDYTHHVNANNLAIIPPCIGKRTAVAYLADRLRDAHGDLFAIGAGDSRTDVPFMSLCDMALIPTRSQIWAGLEADEAGQS